MAEEEKEVLIEKIIHNLLEGVSKGILEVKESKELLLELIRAVEEMSEGKGRREELNWHMKELGLPVPDEKAD